MLPWLFTLIQLTNNIILCRQMFLKKKLDDDFVMLFRKKKSLTEYHYFLHVSRWPQLYNHLSSEHDNWVLFGCFSLDNIHLIDTAVSLIVVVVIRRTIWAIICCYLNGMKTTNHNRILTNAGLREWSVAFQINHNFGPTLPYW